MRVARGVAGVLLGVVALAALAVGGALTFVRTERGGRWLQGTLVPRINAQIAGHLTVTSLRLHGWRLDLRGVTLRAPDGSVVAEAARVEVAAAPLALLRHRLVLERVSLNKPALRLVLDRAGSNLARAVAPRRPKEPTTKGAKDGHESAPMSLSLGTLAVRDGLVDVRVRRPGEQRHVRVEEIMLDGKADYRAPGRILAVELRGRARAEDPLEAPIALDLQARAQGERGKGKVSISVGDSAVEIALSAAGKEAMELEIAEVVIDPRLVRALAPGAPGPAARVRLAGRVRRAGPTVTANLTMTAGDSRIQLDASADPERAVLRGLRVKGQAVDLAALLAEGPRSALDFTLDAHGRGRDLRSLRGEVRLDVPPSPLGPTRAGPVRLHARAEDDGYKLVDLLAELPGLSLRGHGTGTAATLDLEGTLVARDLAATVRSLDGPGPRRLPTVAGNGALRLAVRGPVRGPRVEARGRFPALRFEANRAEGLDVALVMADLRRPQLADLRLRARRVQAGEQRLRDVRLAVASQQPRAFTASVSIADPALSLDTRGRWGDSFEALTIHELRLVYPEARWELSRPTRLRFGPGFAIEDLALTSGTQRIAASLRTTPQLAGQLAIAGLDLGRLPRALVPPSLYLAGVVDVSAEVAGTSARPRGHATVGIARGRFARVEGVDLRLEARHDGRRVAGTLAGRSTRASVSARFDVPAVWPPPGRAPVSLELDVAPFDIPALLASVDVLPPAGLRGQVALKARVQGSFAHPQATVEAHVRRLVVRGEALGDATVALALATPAEGIDARLELRAFGGNASLRARAPLTVARAARLTRTGVMRLPITLTGSADELPLRPLARIAGIAEITGGTLTMRLDARGPARTPAGELKLRLDDLAGRRFPATDATVELSADAQEGPHLVARVTRRGQTLATVDASVRVATAQFDDLAAVAAAPLSVRAHVGPMRVQREGLPPVRERDKTRTMSGLVEADLRLEGTLRAPILAMSATAQDARLDDRPLGRAELVVRYQDARPTVAINAITTAGGALRLTGSAALDLGYPRVLRPIDLRGVPVSIDLESKQLELAAFSGIAAPIRALGGLLTANARLRGKVGAPQVDGRIEWKDGRLVVAELGAYDGIHLLVHGNGQEVVLDELTARAGQGRARLTARADRAGAGGFRVTTDVRLSKFPLYAEGQPLAALSLEASAAGTVSAERIDLSTRVTEAHVFLAEGKRKKLQELKRPPDIVLLDHGKPLNREQARKQRHLATQSPVLPPPEASGPARVGRRVRLAVEAPRNLWIEGPDVHLELGLAEGFVVTVNDEPRVFGTLVVKRGRLELLGRRFDVDGESSVRFTGPPDRPTLAIKATHQSRKAGIGVRVALDGPLDKLEMKLSSPDNPQLGDTELLAVLATGHLPDERSGSTASPGAQAVSVLGGALASQIQKSLSKRLPIDVLVIEPGEGLSGTRLEAGTYLSDALYVAYVGRVGADPFGRENRNEIQLEYQLTRRWSFQGAYGDARRGSADLVWTKNY